jgi:mannose-6-phosphate isomerase
MQLNFRPIKLEGDKLKAFQMTSDDLASRGFRFVYLEVLRPWGFFFYIDPEQTDKFIEEFYKGVPLAGIDESLPLQPKILGIVPAKKLSWQYHRRRSEIWRCVAGSYKVVISDNDQETEPKLIKLGEVVTIGQGQRHRIMGTDKWSIFAEIWQHTDPKNPSNEEDIIRLHDDFGRA